jgi:hypothetical protein
VVFLLLAALYESWSIPLSVIMVIPLGIVGALLATTLRGLSNDIYFQVGLLTTMGLASKNAILIVEFAKDLHEKGMDLVEATVEAVRIRLRPIIMTSLAFVFGVLPLAISNGAGSGSQHAIGTGVIGGMISATLLAIFFVPLFFVIVERIFKPKPRRHDEAVATPARATKMLVRNLTLTLLAASAVSACTLAPRPCARPCRWPTPGRCRRRRRLGGHRRRPGLARRVHRSAPARRDRPGAEQQPRPARGGAQHRAGPRPVPHPARGPVPGVNATATGTRGENSAAQTQPGRPRDVEVYTATVGFTAWELDLFGRVRSLKDAALQSYLATRETSRSVRSA